MLFFANDRILLSIALFNVGSLCFLASHSSAEDWFRWRGPALNGISQETAWSDQWSDSGPTLKWKVNVGTGFSSVSVAQDRLYTVGNRDDIDTLYCLDAQTGKEIWSHSYESPLEAKLFEGGPTSTPAIDGKNIFHLARDGSVFSLDSESGKIHWSTNVSDETGIRIPGWGFSSSPLVIKNRLLLNVGSAGTAIDKLTGKVLWTSDDVDAGYATPVLRTRGDKTTAIFPSGKYLVGVDVQTGDKLWQTRWLTKFGANAADPIISGEEVFVSSGYNRGSMLLKLTAAEPEEVWRSKEFQNQMASSVLIDGHIYGVDGGIENERSLKCVNWKDGSVIWETTDVSPGSLTAANGKLIIMSEDGQLVIARATPKAYQETARAKVLKGKCWTSPVLSGGKLFCRDADGDLVCLDLRSKK